ncbi:MAG: hypothetical protein ABSA57_22475, partial [Candidatus Acidiferrales bacterium]
KSMVRKLNERRVLVRDVRDSLGAHVLEKSVEKALNSMSFDRMGYIEVGRTLKDTHYKFAGELVGEILLAEVPDEKRETAAANHFQTIADLLPVFELTDIILGMYMDARKLAE